MRNIYRKLLTSIGMTLLIGGFAMTGIPVHAENGSHWEQDTVGWSYFNGSSYQRSSWIELDGYWYYFDDNAYMDYSEYRDGCWLNSDGTWDTNYSGGHWASNDIGWWYTDASGWYPTSQWLWIDGSCYFFKADGYIAINEWIDGCWVDANGAWVQDNKNIGDGDEKVVNDWKESARYMLENFNSYDDTRWALIYLNNDDIPELVRAYNKYGKYCVEVHVYDSEMDDYMLLWLGDSEDACYAEKAGIIAEYDPKDCQGHYVEREPINGKMVVYDDPYTHYYVQCSKPFENEKYWLSKKVYDSGKVEYLKESSLIYQKDKEITFISEDEYNTIVEKCSKKLTDGAVSSEKLLETLQ